MTCMRAMPFVRSQTGSVHAGLGLEVTQITALATATSAVQSSTVFVQPVLTGIVNDFIMRCHTTLWFGPAACHPFGYCMCVRKHNKKIVGGYVKKVTQPFLAGRKAYACDKKLVLTDQQLVEMGARAQAITNALSADGPRAFHFSLLNVAKLAAAFVLVRLFFALCGPKAVCSEHIVALAYKTRSCGSARHKLWGQVKIVDQCVQARAKLRSEPWVITRSLRLQRP